MRPDCDICMNYVYDEEYECMTCAVDMDEDEAYSFRLKKGGACPYFRRGDDYTVVRKQI